MTISEVEMNLHKDDMALCCAPGEGMSYLPETSVARETELTSNVMSLQNALGKDTKTKVLVRSGEKGWTWGRTPVSEISTWIGALSGPIRKDKVYYIVAPSQFTKQPYWSRKNPQLWLGFKIQLMMNFVVCLEKLVVVFRLFQKNCLAYSSPQFWRIHIIYKWM